jgi:hypothetical protein
MKKLFFLVLSLSSLLLAGCGTTGGLKPGDSEIGGVVTPAGTGPGDALDISGNGVGMSLSGR